MEWLEQFAQSSEVPFLAAFALGLLTAISPCPLATNITATAFISKDLDSKKAVILGGLIYTLGRGISYSLIGLALFWGASKFHLAKFLQGKGEMFMAPILIIVGLVMLNVIRLGFLNKMDFTQRIANNFRSRGPWGALVLGILFALAFCPYSGALYFGMLIPMTVSQASGLYLPMVYALGTGLPVMVFAFLLAYSAEKVGRTFKILQQTEKVMRFIAGLAFVGTGIYYTLVFLQWI